MDINRKISELTVGELLDLVRSVVANETRPDQRTAFGLQGLADTFGVSLSQAKRIKASGEIDRAISQRGRTIVVDVDLARKLWSQGTHGRNIINR